MADIHWPQVPLTQLCRPSSAELGWSLRLRQRSHLLRSQEVGLHRGLQVQSSAVDCSWRSVHSQEVQCRAASGLFGLDDNDCRCLARLTVTRSLLQHGTTGICIDAALCTSALNTIVTISGGSSICKPKTCPASTVLNEQTGLCACVGDKIFKDAKKSACISVSSCNSKLNTIVSGVCLPKVCLSGQILVSPASLSG